MNIFLQNAHKSQQNNLHQYQCSSYNFVKKKKCSPYNSLILTVWAISTSDNSLMWTSSSKLRNFWRSDDVVDDHWSVLWMVDQHWYFTYFSTVISLINQEFVLLPAYLYNRFKNVLSDRSWLVDKKQTRFGVMITKLHEYSVLHGMHNLINHYAKFEDLWILAEYQCERDTSRFNIPVLNIDIDPIYCTESGLYIYQGGFLPPNSGYRSAIESLFGFV